MISASMQGNARQVVDELDAPSDQVTSGDVDPGLVSKDSTAKPSSTDTIRPNKAK